MKKRIMALLLGISLVCNTGVISFAVESEEALETELQDTDKSEDNAWETIDKSAYVGDMTTATQEEALEEENGESKEAQETEEVEETKTPVTYFEIKIETAEDLINLANNCKMDTWSADKKVILEQDISFRGREFCGIPTFGGIFDGQGHVISDISIDKGASYSGFFGIVQKTAVIRDLKVSGTVEPSGDQTFSGGIAGDNAGVLIRCNFTGVVSGKDYVGGIVGMNELSGIISDCVADGYIHGTHFTGGIAGENIGDIVGCLNESFVNTTNVDPELSDEAKANLDKVISFIRREEKDADEASKDSTISDAGGIAGLSIGIVSKCTNNGDVGYEHVGYNIGGVVGRQSGYITGCTNNGFIQGRKDVGGIVGQAEPFVTVDLSKDIAYQLSESISKLHEIVTKTLGDAKDQSGVITDRLSTIQKFTAGAIDDARYLSAGTIDYANDISSSTNEAFSRVEYVLDEASKQDGFIDQVTYAARDAKTAGSDLRQAVNDLDLDSYLTEEEKEEYRKAKEVIEGAGQQYTENYYKSYKVYFNHEVANEMAQHHLGEDNLGDLVYKCDDGNVYDYDFIVENKKWQHLETVKAALAAENDETGITKDGSWYHKNAETGELTSFPSDTDRDEKSFQEASEEAAKDAAKYTDKSYQSPLGGNSIQADMIWATSVYEKLLSRHMDEMTEAARKDASRGLDNLESAAGHVETAGTQAKETIGTVAGKDPIAFPELDAEYQAHNTSFANNLQGMNDNFGLLNQEVNNASGVIIDDLQAMADQFNVIMNLYTDAIDGVLDADYTTAFEDVSIEEAEISTDATVDRCSNYGRVEGDIDCGGVTGTMAIDYDYDKEGDITGIRDAKLNSAYITKCVLRDVKNFGVVVGEKNYIGGVCGLQEMGTILGAGNYSNISSSSGDYVGGVAGSSISYVLSSFSRGILEGKDYVGGIVGDGLHIRNSFSLVDIKDSNSWSGAIAGHIDDKGEVKNNFFVSDDLAGIDRISYASKAEPVAYKETSNFNLFDESLREVPYEFNYLNVTYVLEDEENGQKKEIILDKTRKKYGEALLAEEFPHPEEREGYYVAWDMEGTDSITTDLVITAKYSRYLTTLSDNVSNDSVYQSQVLVDGKFKEGDKLTVTWSDVVDEGSVFDSKIRNLTSFGTVNIIIPDDGQTVHQLRFRPDNAFYETNGDFTLYLLTENGSKKLKPTGTMGKYKTYDIEGNNVTLSLNFEGLIWSTYKGYALIFVLILAALGAFVFMVGYTSKHKKKIPRVFKKIRKKVSARIESKEQIFYDDEQDELEKLIQKEEAKKQTKEKEDKAKKAAKNESKKRRKKTGKKRRSA